MIDIFTTGGTIDKVYFDALSEYHIGPTPLPEILAENNDHVPHRVKRRMRKDSLELPDRNRTAKPDGCTATESDQTLEAHSTDTKVRTGKWVEDNASKSRTEA